MITSILRRGAYNLNIDYPATEYLLRLKFHARHGTSRKRQIVFTDKYWIVCGSGYLLAISEARSLARFKLNICH